MNSMVRKRREYHVYHVFLYIRALLLIAVVSKKKNRSPDQKTNDTRV
jgi:hypothetical protein